MAGNQLVFQAVDIFSFITFSCWIKGSVAKNINNLIEADHGKLKRLIKPTLGFKSMKTAYATIKGFEVMRMF